MGKKSSKKRGPISPLTLNAKAEMLIKRAEPLIGKLILGRPDLDAATVAAAILSKSGQIYTGVCIHLSCGIGFCAEHAAVAEMIKNRETEIEMIVAVNKRGVLAPCGRCREILVQVNQKNFQALVVLPGKRIVKMRELLPDHWMV